MLGSWHSLLQQRSHPVCWVAVRLAGVGTMTAVERIKRRQEAFGMMKAFIGFTLALFLPTMASATTWYVAPAGNDGYTCAQAQSPATPKSTIRAALACVGSTTGAGAGHAVQVASGTYAETISDWPTGAPGNPFVL